MTAKKKLEARIIVLEQRLDRQRQRLNEQRLQLVKKNSLVGKLAAENSILERKLTEQKVILDRQLARREDEATASLKDFQKVEARYKNLQKAVCKLFEEADCVVIHKNTAVPSGNWEY